jgi:hypothetical protein
VIENSKLSTVWEASWLQSEVEQQLGVFQGPPAFAPAFPTSTPEQLKYRERSLLAYFDQLLGNQWSLGASYRLTESELDWCYPAIPAGTPLFPARTPSEFSRTEGTLLHEVGVRLGFDHPSGFFARAQSRWFIQDNDGYPNALNAGRPDESTYQLDLFLGWRFARRRGEILFGILNLTDQDYRLNSLTPYTDLPRERVWLGRVRFNF